MYRIFTVQILDVLCWKVEELGQRALREDDGGGEGEEAGSVTRKGRGCRGAHAADEEEEREEEERGR